MKWLHGVYSGALTAKSGRSPPADLSPSGLASGDVGLEALAQDVPRAIGGADVVEAMVEILHRAHPWVTRPERSRRIPDEPAGIAGAVGSGGVGVARGASLAVAAVGTRSVLHRRLPGGDEFLGALRQGTAGQLEVVTRVPVVVAPESAHATPVGVGDGDEEVGGCIVEEPEPGGRLEDDIGAFLADP